MKEYLKDNPDVVAYALEWWGKCGSDSPHLTLHEAFDIDDESIDGAIFIKDGTSDTIKAELSTLNAYLGGCVYQYVIEQKCKCEWSADDQWTMIKDGCVGGFYHSLDRKNGDREMYEAMAENWTMTDELRDCLRQLIERASK